VHTCHDSPLHLLQVNVQRSMKTMENASQHMTADHKRGPSGKPALAKGYGSILTCNKYTMGSCFFDQCDRSRNAICGEEGICICPDLMCNEGDGVCQISPDEIQAAVASGVETVESVIGKVSNAMGVATEIASTIVKGVTGTAEVVSQTTGFFNGAAEGVNSAWGTWMDTPSDGCSRDVGFCFLSGCPPSTKDKATCSWGRCTCKPNYCYESRRGEDMCIYDMKKIFDLFRSEQRN